MIVAEQKPIEEIKGFLEGCKRVLVLGCGTCVTVCLAGGEREVGILGSAVRMSLKLIGRGNVVVDECTIERQCEDAFIDILAGRVGDYDAICSLGCGAGVQALARRFVKTPLLPGVNTTFIGVLEKQGVFTEECAGCGDCKLAIFGGICPVTRCAKKLLNGPCGGSQNGKCEVNPETDCAWQLIIERLRILGQMDNLRIYVPPKNWQTSLSGGPRKMVREDHMI